jgi:hypothetical protein
VKYQINIIFLSISFEKTNPIYPIRKYPTLEPIPAGQVVVAGRFAHGTALRLLAIARYVASPRLVPHTNHLRHN